MFQAIKLSKSDHRMCKKKQFIYIRASVQNIVYFLLETA